MVAAVLLGICGAMFETTFNNYLSDIFDMSTQERCALEVPRELPGFLTAAIVGCLVFLPEALVGALCALTLGLGMVGLAFCGANRTVMLLLVLVWSTGMHAMMPVCSSISMDLADERKKGKRLGQIAGLRFAAALIGAATVWIVIEHLSLSYRTIHVVGGVCSIAAAVCFLFIRLPDAHLKRPRFVMRRKYWLYYVLALLFGARKQVFITFAPWVLVRIFNQGPAIFAKLWIISAVLGALLQPLLGKAIDRYGERLVLVFDSVCVIAVCLGYGLSHMIGTIHIALAVLCACYVFDHLLFGVNMARVTYISKIAIDPRDVSATLSVGVSLDHAASMTVPLLGMYLWGAYGHTSVFMAAAGVAALMFIFSLMVNTRK